MKSTLIPYLIFFIVSFLWTNTAVAYVNGVPFFSYAYSWSELFKAFVFSGESLFNNALITSPLWFFHALFLGSFIFYFLVKIKNMFVLNLLAFVLLLATLPLQAMFMKTAYWVLGLLPCMLFFMLVGYMLKLYSGRLAALLNRLEKTTGQRGAATLLNSFISLGLLLACFYVMRSGRGDMWAITSEWYFLGALLFSAACYFFARESQNAVLAFVGENSMLYLGVHPLVLMLPQSLGLLGYFKNIGFDGVLVYLAYFIANFLIISLVVYIIATVMRFFKFIVKSKKQLRG